MQTASAALNSRWKARPIGFPKTMGATHFTGALKVSTSAFGTRVKEATQQARVLKRWRRGLSRHPVSAGVLYRNSGQRIEDRVQRDDRSSDDRQSHQSLLLQSGGGWFRRYLEASSDDLCG